MAKARITFTVVTEYEFVPEYYDNCETPEQMLAVDVSNANEDPYLMIGDDAEWTITGEVLA